MSISTLAITLSFVALALIISIRQKLGIERDIIVATIRSAIQLLVAGYLLKMVFSFQSPFFIIGMILIMVLVASQNVKKRAGKRKKIFSRVFTTIMLTEFITQGFLLSAGIVPIKAQFIIPISGMIIGNAMVVSSLLFNRLQGEIKSRNQEILVVLCLGGTIKQAMLPILKDAVRASLIPTIDSTKTIGLVQLPGMMTGQIIAGADPIQAVRYQLLIVFTLMASAALTSVVLSSLVYSGFFNQYQQLDLETNRPSI